MVAAGIFLSVTFAFLKEAGLCDLHKLYVFM